MYPALVLTRKWQPFNIAFMSKYFAGTPKISFREDLYYQKADQPASILEDTSTA